MTTDTAPTTPLVSLHVENTVQDFDAWKQVFDKFEQFRVDHGVLAYRLVRHAEDHQQVMIDLDFADRAGAEAFGAALQQIWGTPQSQRQLIAHSAPVVLDLVTSRHL